MKLIIVLASLLHAFPMNNEEMKNIVDIERQKMADQVADDMQKLYFEIKQLVSEMDPRIYNFDLNRKIAHAMGKQVE